MSRPGTESASGLTLGDYFDEVNDVAAVNFADMSVDSKYSDLESLATSCMASDSFNINPCTSIYVVWQANITTLKG